MTRFKSLCDRRGRFAILGSSVTKLLIILTGFLLVSCSDDDKHPTAEIRVIHASPDAPNVNVALNDNNVIENLDYAESSGFVTIDAGSYSVAVDGNTPSGAVRVINLADVEFAENTKTNVIATDNLAAITALAITDTTAMPTANEVGIQVVHASPDAPLVDVYVTALGADLNTSTPNFSLDFGESIDVGALAASAYQIRLTLSGQKTAVYDSGEVDLAPFAGSNLFIAALSATGATQTAASPVKLLVATDDTFLQILDINTSAGLRVVHASPDAGAAAGGPVEVFATSNVLGANPVELIDSFSYTDSFPSVSTHAAVPAGEYTVDVAPDSDTIGDSVSTTSGINLTAGTEYTAIASGRVLTDPAFGLLLATESVRSIVTHSSVRVIHSAPAAGDVDVYVTAAGQFTAAEVESGAAGDPALADFSFGDITDFLQLAPGNYDVRVLAGGVTAINVENASFSAGAITTVIARGPEEPSGSLTDFGVILLSN